jgi:hypothetical protein
MKRLGLIALVAALSSCATAPEVQLGEAHRWNIEQQVVDPDPQYEGTLIEGGSGVRNAAAADRYNRGQVKALTAVDTTTSGGTATGTAGPK